MTIDFHGRRRAGSQVSVEFRDPDGHALEIFWGLDKVDWHGEARPAEEWAPKHTLEEAVDQAPPGQDTTLADPSRACAGTSSLLKKNFCRLLKKI